MRRRCKIGATAYASCTNKGLPAIVMNDSAYDVEQGEHNTVATMVQTLTFLKPYCHFTFDPEICSKEASGANRADLLQEGPEFGLEQI